MRGVQRAAGERERAEWIRSARGIQLYRGSCNSHSCKTRRPLALRPRSDTWDELGNGESKSIPGISHYSTVCEILRASSLPRAEGEWGTKIHSRYQS